jgi:hypothetical protein
VVIALLAMNQVSWSSLLSSAGGSSGRLPQAVSGGALAMRCARRTPASMVRMSSGCAK